MNLNTLGELIRTDEPPAPSPHTVDRLVTGALRRGRRTRIGRRVAAGVAGGALLVTGAAVVLQLPGRAAEVAPAGPPTTTEPQNAEPPPARPPTTTEPQNAEPPTHLDVLAVLKATMPGGFTTSQHSGDNKMAGEVSIAFTASDRTGRAFVAGGIVNEVKDLACEDGCTRESLAGGTVLVMRDFSDEKAGDGTWYYYKRADGSWIWFGQANAFEGKGPVTRPEVPLSETQVRQLLTAPEWEPLVDRCRAAGSDC